MVIAPDTPLQLLRQIQSVRRSLRQHALLTLVHALVITKLDHCNSVLAGTAVYLQNWLQSVLNAAARLIFSRRASEHTPPLMVPTTLQKSFSLTFP